MQGKHIPGRPVISLFRGSCRHPGLNSEDFRMDVYSGRSVRAGGIRVISIRRATHPGEPLNSRVLVRGEKLQQFFFFAGSQLRRGSWYGK